MEYCKKETDKYISYTPQQLLKTKNLISYIFEALKVSLDHIL